MVTQFGMSESLGAINYGPGRRPTFLDMTLGTERGPYSEETAQQIDVEVKRILTEAHERARQVLNERRATLRHVATMLLEKEVIEGDELRLLIANAELKEPPAASRAPSASHKG